MAAQYLKRFLVQAITLGGIAYVLLAGLLYVSQSSMVYLPDAGGRSIVLTPEDRGMAFDEVWLATEDGERIHGWFVPAPETPARGAIILFHGNAGNISHRLETLRLWHSLNVHALIIDYRGYGLSSGSPSEQGTYRDARAAWAHLTDQRQIPPQQIIIFGRSLGGGVAAQLASEVEPGGLILESTFTSIPDLGADLYWWLPVRLLARFRYDNRARLARVSCPVLIVHSPDDEIMPFSHAEGLLAAAAPPKQLLTIRGSHNRGFLQSGALYTEGLSQFIDTLWLD